MRNLRGSGRIAQFHSAKLTLPPKLTLKGHGAVHLREVAHHRQHFKAREAGCDQSGAQASLPKRRCRVIARNAKHQLNSN